MARWRDGRMAGWWSVGWRDVGIAPCRVFTAAVAAAREGCEWHRCHIQARVLSTLSKLTRCRMVKHRRTYIILCSTGVVGRRRRGLPSHRVARDANACAPVNSLEPVLDFGFREIACRKPWQRCALEALESMSELRVLKRRAGIAEEVARIKKERLDEAEQFYEEEHRTFMSFLQRREEVWEQRFELLARMASAAGVQHEDIDALRKQPWQDAAAIPELERVAAVEQAAASERAAAAEQAAAAERSAAAEDEAAVARDAAAELDAAVNWDFWDAAIEALRTGDSDNLKAELQKPRCNVNEVFDGSVTVLYMCCLGARPDLDNTQDASCLVKLLLDAGADVGIANGDATPLNVAVTRGHADTVRLLLMAGAEDTSYE